MEKKFGIEVITPATTKGENIEAIEKLYKTYYDELPFTSHKELEKYMAELEKVSHNKRIKLRMLRKSKNISIPIMADLLDISKDGYFKIESGATYPKLKTAFKIAKLLDSTVDELFGC